MEPPPPELGVKEFMAESTSKHKKPPATFSDLPSEITQKIVHEFASIRENRVGDTRGQLTNTGENLSYTGEDIQDVLDGEKVMVSHHPRINHCRLKVLNIMTSCSKLYVACLEVLLQQNKFVAIRGYNESLTTWLKVSGIMSYWTPPWAGRWDKDTGCWTVNNTIFCPELTINFPDCDLSRDGPFLAPIEDLDSLVLALTLSLYRGHLPWSKTRQIQLIVKGTPKSSVYGAPPDTSVFDILRERVLFWLGRWVFNVSISQSQGQPGDSLEESDKLAIFMGQECDHQHKLWCSEGESLGQAVYNHLRKFALEVEMRTSMEETENSFLAMGRLQDQVYCWNQSQLMGRIPILERFRLDRIVAYARVRLGALEDPQCFGTLPRNFWIALVEQLMQVSFLLRLRLKGHVEWNAWIHLRLAELRLRAGLEIQDVYRDLHDSASCLGPPHVTGYGSGHFWATEMLKNAIPDFGRWTDSRGEDWGSSRHFPNSEWAAPPSEAQYKICMEIVDLLKEKALARFGPLGNLESHVFDQEARETAS